MAVSIDTINLLWNDLVERNWEELYDVVDYQKEKVDPKEAEEILAAIEVLKDEPFPESSRELYEIISLKMSDEQKTWITKL